MSKCNSQSMQISLICAVLFLGLVPLTIQYATYEDYGRYNSRPYDYDYANIDTVGSDDMSYPSGSNHHHLGEGPHHEDNNNDAYDYKPNEAASDPQIIVIPHIDEPSTSTPHSDDAAPIEENLVEEPTAEEDSVGDNEQENLEAPDAENVPSAESAGDEENSETEAAEDEENDSDDDSSQAVVEPEPEENHEEHSSAHSESCSHAAQAESGLSNKDMADKLNSLASTIELMNHTIERMEALMQSTILDERIYKCISALSSRNETLALKFWNQILRYQTDAGKKKSMLDQIVSEVYSKDEETFKSLLTFIQQTKQFYAYEILFKEMKSHEQMYESNLIFSLAHAVKKSCGRSSLFMTFPKAVQLMVGGSFTLQNKENKGFLFYAKRCVARHYHYCLDVLTKKIEIHELDNLESLEDQRKYSWKLNATDNFATRFFILNTDKYWSYRLQDLKNSPRFKMEEASSFFEKDWAQFQIKLVSDEQVEVEIRDTNIYLEGKEFNAVNGTELLLNSVHKTEKFEKHDSILWIVRELPWSSRNDVDDDIIMENCSV